MGIFIAQAGVIGILAFVLFTLNRRKEGQREAAGLERKIVDKSMATKFETEETDGPVKSAAELAAAEEDLSDFKS